MKKITVLLFLATIFAGCTRPSPATPAPAAEWTPQPTYTPYPTATPYPTYTPYPTCTPPVTTLEGPTPSPTLSETPTITPTVTATVTATATIAPQTLCPNRHAQLTYPTSGTEVIGRVEVRGSADIDNFWYYKFEMRARGESGWAFLQRFDAPVTNGVLGYWDTSALQDGAYSFRLVVVDQTGNYPEPCEVDVQVQH